jgi:hypothetical protein
MITLAVQRGNMVSIYNEKNAVVRSIQGELYGYTQSTVSIKRNNQVLTYDENGKLISTVYVR